MSQKTFDPEFHIMWVVTLLLSICVHFTYDFNFILDIVIGFLLYCLVRGGGHCVFHLLD
ncbi:TMhelix containing protein [Vibrio phage 1.063.O._10N.261.45.C7]|nr:TMhelix containing protein [Vibrio phage 1.063.O._10N.261.45.C7]